MATALVKGAQTFVADVISVEQTRVDHSGGRNLHEGHAHAVCQSALPCMQRAYALREHSCFELGGLLVAQGQYDAG